MALKITRFFEFIGFLRFKNSRNAINARNSRDSINTRSARILLLTVCCLLVAIFGGCASLQKEKVLAVVDGEPITEGELKYSLTITHRKEDLSSAGTLNLSRYIEKMIDDRLIIDDARRTGMDQYPEVQQAIQAYILRESVVRLHDDEILKKISITERDILDYYRKFYERFILNLIEVKSESEAGEVSEQLRKGVDFGELVEKYSMHPSKKEGGEVVLSKNSMPPYIEKTVSVLKPGELSDVIKGMDRYYIIKLMSRNEPPDEELSKVRGNIERAIKKLKEKERSDEYLKYLREQAKISIDRDLLSTISPGGSDEEKKKWSKDERILAEINGSALTAAEFVAMAVPYSRKSTEDVLNSWVDRKLVDHEALSRHYENNPDLKKKIYRYENQLLKNTFIKRVILPKVEVSDKIIQDYYSSHKKDFVKPASFRIQQITVKTKDEAQDILNNLKNGADFSWLAERKSVDSAASKGGDAGWFAKPQLPEAVRNVIDSLKIGDISPVVKSDSLFMIVRLQGKVDEEVEEFNKVRDAVYRACFDDQVSTLLEKYIAQLKTGAEITIFEDKIRSLEEKMQE